MKPLAIELFCGMFGWSAGWLEMGGQSIGFDIEHLPHHGSIPRDAELVLQDVLTLHGSQFKDADLILCSPPCQEFSYMAMPWTRAKQISRAFKGNGEFPDGYTGSRTIPQLTALFDACFRIQREASEAAGRHIPMVVENVKGAQPWVGRAKAHYGSFYLWGDIAMHGNRLVIPGQIAFGAGKMAPRRLLKQSGRNFHFPEKHGIPSPSFHGAAHEPSVAEAMELAGSKNDGGSWFGVAHNTESGVGQNPVNGLKVGGAAQGVSFTKKEGVQSVGFNVQAARNWRAEHESGVKCHGQKHGEEYAMTRGATKTVGHVNKRDAHTHTHHLTNQAESNAVKNGGDWFSSGENCSEQRKHSSKSDSRKAASAAIAKIPTELSRWIAKSYYPMEETN